MVKLQGDFTFMQSAKIKDFVTDLHITGAPSSDSATSTYVLDSWIFSENNFKFLCFLKDCADMENFVIRSIWNQQDIKIFISDFVTILCVYSLLNSYIRGPPDFHYSSGTITYSNRN